MIDRRYLVLTWWNRAGAWQLHHATIAHSLRKAKQLRTMGLRYPGKRISIVPETLIAGIGEMKETPKPNRKKFLSDNLAKLTIKTLCQ